MRKVLIGLVIVGMLFLFSANALSEIEISYSPSEPGAGETIKFYFNTTANVSSAKLWIEECKGNQCFLPETLNMEQASPGSYVAEYKLRDDTTLVHYKVNVTFQNGSYTETKIYEFEVEPKSQTSTEEKAEETPGFEVYGVVISVIVAILILRRLSR